ncbi:DUF4062 domain-containing protein [Candidatus Nitrosocosmicus arcticus]|uniref:DUF4062 domain-containing protein n=1 Tax=Candidatus Nitrosocosmicus arcticus TaxID=2035267 RepID=A0A557SYX4_9ARCH|nr:DUF4062 domain-containing protein [Candidatus Nitrosocosmicus arcticus]TVP41793.1 hypothetical protein NARC_10199 [Candidatus Nitrosocosmicus arcticus]
MADQLKVFISSKEGELESERLMVIKAIKSLFLNPVSSEIRSAKFRSMKEVNEKEVRSSDIYIGIFGRKYSSPTIQEFSIAKSSMIKRFIFKKYLKESETRDEQLKQIVKEVEDAEQGTVTEYFLDIFD